MNEHKFYNEYIKPVLEEIKEELNKRGVDTFIDGNELLIGGGGKGMSILTYNYAFAEFNVHEDYHNFFENEFNAVNCTTELAFKEFPSPLVEKSIYDLGIGDEFYYESSVTRKKQAIKFKIKTIIDYGFYKELLQYDKAFLTQEECEKRIAKNQAIAKIKKRAHELQGDWKPNWASESEAKVYIEYRHDKKKLSILVLYTFQTQGICLKSAKIAQQIIDELPEECKLMLEVE